MREIKFRAWDKKEKKMYSVSTLWISGLTINVVETIASHSDRYKEIPLKDCELMEFTGLKDRNGKEIYEGDIVTVQCGFEESDRSEPALVELVYGCWSNGGSHLFGCKAHEIIGNVHEDAELLEKP